MREIRFRYVCRNKHFNEIELVYLTDDIILQRHNMPTWILTDNCEILDKQMSTGLKDKNGVEIFEGDIFGNIPQLRCVVVKEDDGAYKLHFCDKRIAPISILDHKVKNSDIEGNIYQNPELLQQGE
jgi:hypothetical protein